MLRCGSSEAAPGRSAAQAAATTRYCAPKGQAGEPGLETPQGGERPREE